MTCWDDLKESYRIPAIPRIPTKRQGKSSITVIGDFIPKDSILSPIIPQRITRQIFSSLFSSWGDISFEIWDINGETFKRITCKPWEKSAMQRMPAISVPSLFYSNYIQYLITDTTVSEFYKDYQPSHWERNRKRVEPFCRLEVPEEKFELCDGGDRFAFFTLKPLKQSSNSLHFITYPLLDDDHQVFNRYVQKIIEESCRIDYPTQKIRGTSSTASVIGIGDRGIEEYSPECSRHIWLELLKVEVNEVRPWSPIKNRMELSRREEDYNSIITFCSSSVSAAIQHMQRNSDGKPGTRVAKRSNLDKIHRILEVIAEHAYIPVRSEPRPANLSDARQICDYIMTSLHFPTILSRRRRARLEATSNVIFKCDSCSSASSAKVETLKNFLDVSFSTRHRLDGKGINARSKLSMLVTAETVTPQPAHSMDIEIPEVTTPGPPPSFQPKLQDAIALASIADISASFENIVDAYFRVIGDEPHDARAEKIRPVPTSPLSTSPNPKKLKTLQPEKPQTASDLEGVSILTSESFIAAQPWTVAKLHSEYRIEVVDCSLPFPLIMEIDSASALSVISFDILTNDSTATREYLVTILALSFKYSQLWIILEKNSNDSFSGNVESANDIEMKFYQALSQSPITIIVRSVFIQPRRSSRSNVDELNGTKLARNIHNIIRKCAQICCAQRGETFADYKSRRLYATMIQQRPGALVHLEFLQLFPTINATTALILQASRPFKQIFLLDANHLSQYCDQAVPPIPHALLDLFCELVQKHTGIKVPSIPP